MRPVRTPQAAPGAAEPSHSRARGGGAGHARAARGRRGDGRVRSVALSKLRARRPSQPAQRRATANRRAPAVRVPAKHRLRSRRESAAESESTLASFAGEVTPPTLRPRSRPEAIATRADRHDDGLAAAFALVAVVCADAARRPVWTTLARASGSYRDFCFTQGKRASARDRSARLNCPEQARAPGRRRPHTWKARASSRRAVRRGRLLTFVRLSSERARQAVRQDCSFAKKQESSLALLVVVQGERVGVTERDACFRTGAGASDPEVVLRERLLVGRARVLPPGECERQRRSERCARQSSGASTWSAARLATVRAGDAGAAPTCRAERGGRGRDGSVEMTCRSPRDA
jgi:hypothetical protein